MAHLSYPESEFFIYLSAIENPEFIWFDSQRVALQQLDAKESAKEILKRVKLEEEYHKEQEKIYQAEMVKRRQERQRQREIKKFRRIQEQKELEAEIEKERKKEEKESKGSIEFHNIQQKRRSSLESGKKALSSQESGAMSDAGYEILDLPALKIHHSVLDTLLEEYSSLPSKFLFDQDQ
ncbi:hypothetical protein ADUPG1_012524 [Aduncisulcus paluster]|uniref:Uncharacterized protein n=1 Tax=Aduncisulcus paluster TaxID=2918883 RepID=A0ABQ5K319_9EUKA|nr:hypothetical protein ADUPG1_012524 [Aduncisulcus paluster]|eukprot:gnl/Carplike_NY0171/3083_a4140_471.p1 GENE.gnl/Carplike_NY0171/3083_a4140_471~~gnl/Carplike_NY0171/3083_a4140_471.p1  ORF type:complete len:180 (-),score=25.54 gnl/Carplike_NY0171/3083_a4140_471:98-637(-)